MATPTIADMLKHARLLWLASTLLNVRFLKPAATALGTELPVTPFTQHEAATAQAQPLRFSFDSGQSRCLN